MRGASAVLLAAILTGCAGGGGAASVAPSLIAVPTQPPPPADGTPMPCPAALTEGELIADEAWGIALDDQYTGEVRKVIWPHGFAARRDGDRLALLDGAREVVAREGDQVRIDGGESGPDAWLTCGSITVLRQS